ncbi:DGQHR domain-containing protein [Methanorbis furvi]|uniref:DGQHR domain-containing protein n=1 Tax=Methanorbis furvi TaxID=3028299 RepID=A0AAE4MD63_9EURY|nr:hypothetical protein [Methanocorpusculaceae archaeon Ag1]
MKKIICSSCGREILDKVHGPYSDDQYVCDKCWNDPSLFFEDKIASSFKVNSHESLNLTNIMNQIETIDMYLSAMKGDNSEISETWLQLISCQNLHIPVLRFSQKNVPLFIGKIHPAELLVMSSIDQWNEEKLEGYQRERIKEKNREIKEFLKNCALPIVPPIIASVRNSTFQPISDDYGTMETPIYPGNIVLIDGQQRTGGFFELFHEIRSEIRKFNQDTSKIVERYNEFLQFEIPILLINPNQIIQKMHKCDESSLIRPIDIERAFFFVINKTQKSVNSSLKDELAYLTLAAGITGIPAIEKEKWRAELVPIVNELNKKGSPLHGLISLGGISGLRRPIPLTSFVSSLKPLYDNTVFHEYSQDQKLQFLSGYWSAIKSVFPFAFDESKRYLLTKTIGMYPMNSLSVDILNKMLEDGKDPLNGQDIYSYVLLLKNIDWSVETSDFRYYIGKKGTGKGYQQLKDCFWLELANT